MFADFVSNILGVSDSLVADITVAVLGTIFVSLIISFMLGFCASLSHKLFK